MPTLETNIRIPLRAEEAGEESPGEAEEAGEESPGQPTVGVIVFSVFSLSAYHRAVVH